MAGPRCSILLDYLDGSHGIAVAGGSVVCSVGVEVDEVSILLTTEQNPHGVLITQELSTLYVNSGCCNRKITARLDRSSGGEWVWSCSHCSSPVSVPLRGGPALRAIYDLPDDPRYGVEWWIHCWTGLNSWEFTVDVEI